VLLLGGAVAFALLAAAQAIRARRRTLGAAAAAAATTSFVYFCVHGSVDWFFELPALGCLAFASLGIAAGLAPRTIAPPWSRPRRTLAGTAPRLAAAVVVAGLVGASFAGPWLSARDAERAREDYNANPTPAGGQRAIDRLDRAAALNPLTPRPRILQGKIDVALGQLEFAARDFRAAIDRDPHYQYAYVALASIESSRGKRAAAIAAARKAVELSPRDRLARDVLSEVSAGRRVDFGELDTRFSARSSERVQ
jgi:tetratricopeptide (TPR) repeat protein